MADLDFNISVNNSQAVASLNKLEQGIQNLNNKFDGLKQAIAGIALGGFIQQTVQAATAIKNMADATGIASTTINGFSQAMVAAGGSSDQALDAISDLTSKIGEAAIGSAELQEAFKKVGVSINDLRTLSEEDILRKTIEGLAKIPDSGTRTALAFQLMGEAVKGVDLARMNRDLDGYITRSANMAGPLNAAQGAQRNLAIAMENFRTATLKALAPLLDFLANLKPEQIEKFVNAVVEIGVALAAIAGSLKVLQLLGTVLTYLGGLWVTFKTALFAAGAAMASTGKWATNLSAGLARMGVGFGTILTNGYLLRTLLAVLGARMAAILIPFAKVIAIGAAVAFTLYQIAKASDNLMGTDIIGWFDRAGKAVANFFGIQYKTEKEKQALAAQTKAEDEAEIKRLQAKGQATDAQSGKLDEQRKVIDAVAEAIKSQTQEIENSVNAYRAGNADVERRLKFEQSLIGLGEQQKTIKQSLFDIESKYISEVTRLTELYAEKSKSSKEEDQRMLPIIQAALGDVTKEYQRQIDAVKALTEQNQQLIELEAQRKALSEFTTQTQIDNQRALRDIQAETAKLTMTEIEKKYYDIARAAEESARTAITAENARRKSMGVPEMTQTEIEQYYKAATAGVKDLMQAQQRHEQTSRSWSTGWTKAFKEYRDSASNAAARAESIFKKATQGMEDMIVDFAKTGRLEWKSFVASMAEELLRGQVRSVIADLLGPIGEFFGMDLGSLSGAAPGGTANNPMFVYDVSGGGKPGAADRFGSALGGNKPTGTAGTTGAGGSIWDTAKQVGSSVGGVIGDIWTGVKDFGSSVWDTVSSIGSSVSDFFGSFGGLFANGGTLGAGKWGIAGEAGAEMVTGPATITPMNQMGGGVTNVTYNINAVDAMSFKALVAADPGFIHAVAQQGARAIPSRR